MKINNKKGWMRILEAFLSIMIVSSALLVITSTNPENSDSSEFILDKQNQLLFVIENNESLRNQIITGNLNETINFISGNIPNNWRFSLNLCELDELCNQGALNNSEIFISDTIITANFSDYRDEIPRKLRFLVWIK